MFQIKNNTISINKTMKLSPKQLRRLENLSEPKQKDYLWSILGKKINVKHKKPADIGKYDKLAEKQPNHFKRKFEAMLDNGCDVNHSPIIRTKNSCWVGVEIECYIEHGDHSCDYCNSDGDQICGYCDGDGYLYATDCHGGEHRVDCDHCDGNGYATCDVCGGTREGGYFEEIRQALRREKITNCSVRSDGSLDDGGLEVCLLFDASKGFEKLEKVCKILNNMRATVNEDCGLHVHIDHRNDSESKTTFIGRGMGKFLPILSKLVPESRRNTTYCRLQASATERYSAINMSSYRKHNTIEYRLHSGTTNAEKIKNWIELLLALEKTAKGLHQISTADTLFKLSQINDVTTLDRLFDLIDVSPEIKEFYKQRYEKFNPVSDETEAEAA